MSALFLSSRSLAQQRQGLQLTDPWATAGLWLALCERQQPQQHQQQQGWPPPAPAAWRGISHGAIGAKGGGALSPGSTAPAEGQGLELSWPADGGAASAAAAAAFAAPPPPPAVPPLLEPGCAALDALHSSLGLPWWAAIPATTLTTKLALLPLSLRQAKIVRSNMAIWTESHEISKQRGAKDDLAISQAISRGSGSGEPGSPAAGGLAAAQESLVQLQRWRRRVQIYSHLRAKCGVPHPAWFLANNLVQWPVFVYLGICVRAMAAAGAPWPGMRDGGALWFPDLTLPAVLMGDAAAAAAAAGAVGAAGGGAAALPMGAAGLGLPLLVTGLMLTSIRIGFRASGAASRHPSVTGTFLQPVLKYAPAALYTLTLGSLYFKLQLPQAVLLHWLASSGFTLSLQLALRSPRLRALLGYGSPAAAGNTSVTGGVTGVTGVTQQPGIDPGLEIRVAAAGGADVLVAMAAKESALHRYREAAYCLEKAVEMEPGNAGAHYAAAQVAALTGDWRAAEAAYARCAAAALAAHQRDAHSDYSSFVGQARFCVGTARARQGRHELALEAYDEAEAAGYRQPHALGQARGAALLALGRLEAAADAVNGALAASPRLRGDGFVDMEPVLLDLRARIEAAARRRDEEGGGGGGGGGGA